MFDREWLKTILYFIVMIACVYLMTHYVAQRTVVDGGSMETTLYDGDNLILNRLAYRFSDPERYDIVVFPVDDLGLYRHGGLFWHCLCGIVPSVPCGCRAHCRRGRVH